MSKQHRLNRSAAGNNAGSRLRLQQTCRLPHPPSIHSIAAVDQSCFSFKTLCSHPEVAQPFTKLLLIPSSGLHVQQYASILAIVPANPGEVFTPPAITKQSGVSTEANPGAGHASSVPSRPGTGPRDEGEAKQHAELTSHWSLCHSRRQTLSHEHGSASSICWL